MINNLETIINIADLCEKYKIKEKHFIFAIKNKMLEGAKLHHQNKTFFTTIEAFERFIGGQGVITREEAMKILNCSRAIFDKLINTGEIRGKIFPYSTALTSKQSINKFIWEK